MFRCWSPLLPTSFLLSAFLFSGCLNLPDTPGVAAIEGLTMGTTYTVKMSEVSGPEVESIKGTLHEIFETVNRQMSTYVENSEISRFNRYDRTSWFPISPDFAAVLRKALEISHLSSGAFDITIGRIVNLWGFGPAPRGKTVPSEQEIADEQAATGYLHLAVRSSPSSVKKELPYIYCDLSAIAKGFAVDKASEFLDSLDIQNYMVEIGGEVRVRGKNQQGQLWRIAIEKPGAGRGFQRVVRISDIGMATSGDYANYFEEGGTRYSHTIDPRTGRPVTHSLVSVTVLHPSCMTADGLATAVQVLGPEDGNEFALREQLPVLMIIREEKGLVEKWTPEFEQFF